MAHPEIKRGLSAILILALVCGAGAAWAASELSLKMEKLAKGFDKTYSARPGAEALATVAVFPFQSEEKVGKQRVGPIVSDMLTYHLLQIPRFKLVERTELERALKEQALSLTGVIESESAVKVGKLLGARLLVLGNAGRMRKAYQISARLVDAQTGELVASDYIEVPAKIFEEEASRYQVVVPERQAIGLYLIGGGSAPAESPSYPSQTYAGTFHDSSYSVTVSPKPVKIGGGSFGLGVRYFPSKWVMLDGGYLFSSYQVMGEGDFVNITAPSRQQDGSGYFYFNMKSTSIFSSLNGVLNPLGALRCYLGFGMDVDLLDGSPFGSSSQTIHSYDSVAHENYTLYINESTDKGSSPGYGGGQVLSVGGGKTNPKVYPFLRLGGEWRPQSRVGICLLWKYLLSDGNSDPVKLYITGATETADSLGHISYDTFTLTPSEMDVFILRPPRSTFSGTLSFYF
jgi:curli biogenesis system outer membrane secretion channel CsgG